MQWIFCYWHNSFFFLFLLIINRSASNRNEFAIVIGLQFRANDKNQIESKSLDVATRREIGIDRVFISVAAYWALKDSCNGIEANFILPWTEVVPCFRFTRNQNSLPPRRSHHCWTLSEIGLKINTVSLDETICDATPHRRQLRDNSLFYIFLNERTSVSSIYTCRIFISLPRALHPLFISICREYVRAKEKFIFTR